MDAADGLLYHDNDDGLQQYVQCKTGDVMKCTLVKLTTPKNSVSVEFYHNERLITAVTAEIPLEGFYGVVGLASPRECIVIGPPQREESKHFNSLFELKTPHVRHTGNGTCTYVPPTSPTYSYTTLRVDEAPPMYIGTIRSIEPVEPGSHLDVRLLNKGEESAIAIGLCTLDYPIDSLPGWLEHSLAYHADISCILNGTADKERVSEWKEGTTLSCFIESSDGGKEMRVIFRKERDIIWKDKLRITSSSESLYWCIGMMSKEEKIQVLLPRRILPLDIQRLPFENVWQLPSPTVEYTDKGVCLYVSTGENPGTIRSREPINPLLPFPFFDVKIINFGKSGEIVIGVVSANYSKTEMPGWKPKSISFQCSTGHLYQSTEFPTKTNHQCVPGDVIRCTVSPVDGCAKSVDIIFHCNDKLVAKTMDWAPEGGFYAQIGMMSEGEVLQVACPTMVPSSLKQGLVGFSPNLTRPLRDVMKRAFTAPIKRTLQLESPTDHVDFSSPSGRYNYVPPVASPHVNKSIKLTEGGANEGRGEANEGRGGANEGGDFKKRSQSVDERRDPPGSFKKFEQRSEPGFLSQSLPLVSTPATPSTPTTPKRPSTAPVTPYTPPITPFKLTTPTKPITTPTTPATPTKPLTTHTKPLATPTTPATPIKPTTPITTIPEEPIIVKDYKLQKLPKSVNHLFSFLHCVTHSPTNDTLTVNDAINECQYAYAVRRKSLTEKTSYFEVDFLSSPTHGIAVGLSSGKLLGNRLLGTYPGTVSLHTLTGEVYSGSSTALDIEGGEGSVFKQGDTLGCGVSIITDSTFRPNDNKNLYTPSQIKVLFYKNASLIVEVMSSLSLSSLYPSICFETPQSRIKFVCNYNMKPCDYFDTHPVPEGHQNFPQPPSLSVTTNGWCTIQGGQGCEFAIEKPHITRLSSLNRTLNDVPIMIQHTLPFSLSYGYFEVELTSPASTYSLISLGSITRLTQGPNIPLPGETEGSVGFYPLTGLVMRNGGVVSYIQDQVIAKANSSRGNLRIGIGIEIDSKTINDESRNILLFFTIDRQEISKLVCTIPRSTYLYPTLVIQPHVSQLPVVDHTLCRLMFPSQWPSSLTSDSVGLPFAFARLSPGFKVACSTFLQNTTNETKGAQCCYPLSPNRSYFKVSILESSDYEVSVGLSPLLHSLDLPVGLGQYSIGYLVNSSGVFYNGLKITETPLFNSMGVTIGCGILFPEDGNLGNAEVFFVVNSMLISRHFVQVPTSGLFPSLSLSKSLLTLDLSCKNPFPNMKYSSQWLILDNVLATNQTIQLISHAHIGIAQLIRFATNNETIYFKTRLPSSLDSGKILTGFSNCTDSPFTPKVSPENHSIFIELSTGTIIAIQNGQRRSDECSIPKGTSEIGCGISPIKNSNYSLIFFTADNQVVYTANITLLRVTLHPIIYMIGTTSKIKVEACPIWLPISSVGFGWARSYNIQYTCSAIIPTSSTSGTDIGFIQSCAPLMPSQSYFEVEVLSRDPKKAIAVGLASRHYNHTQWLGWKPEAISYHLDDGKLYKANGTGINFGPKLFQGDVIGCGIRYRSINSIVAKGTRQEVFFTINGFFLPKTEMMTVPDGGLFPSVCLESISESVNIHLKASPFGTNKLNSDMWSRSYCISQAGNILEHSFQMKGQKVSPFPEGFCQAREPLSMTHCYFEVDILSLGEKSNLSIGLAPLQELESHKITTNSVMLNVSGTIIVSEVGKTTPTPSRQKCEAGDRIGCRLRPSTNKAHLCAEFCRNDIKIMFTPLPASFRDLPLYPTIILTQGEDSVIPLLYALPPSNVPTNQIGWLRTERVKTKGSIVEYSGLGPSSPRSVGVAQMNQPLNKRHPYFEIEILDTGDTCKISIGAAAIDHPLTQQPGWVRGSIGHHGDDGRLFYESGTGCSFGPPWKRYEVIGFGIRTYSDIDITPGSEVQVFITRNGIEIGHMTVTVPESGLFPAVGFHGKGERIKINHNARQSNTLIKSRLKWRTIVGMKHKYAYKQQKDVLTYLDTYRSTPIGLNCGIGIAISYESFSEDLKYFEVTLLSIGDCRAIAIGACRKNYSPDLVPGWGEGSIAYHTDTGALHHANGQGKQFGPIAVKGHTVGCGVSLSSTGTHCSVFFTLNGVQIGHRIQAAVPKGGLFPVIGFVSSGDKVSVKFMDAFKPRPLSSDSLVGLMRIQNSSYSDHLLTFSSGVSTGPANAQFAVALNSSRNYFRASIIRKADGIRIGLAPRDYPLTHPPGASSYSIAYDITEGIIRGVFGRTVVSEHVQNCVPGDVVGCGVSLPYDEDGEDCNHKKQTTSHYVFFTRNDEVVHQLELPDLFDDLFPIVGFLPNARKSAVYMDWNVSTFETKNVL